MSTESKVFRQGELLWMAASFTSKLNDGIAKSNGVSYDCMQNVKGLLENMIEESYLAGKMQALSQEVQGMSAVVGGGMAIGSELVSLGGVIGQARDIKNQVNMVQERNEAQLQQAAGPGALQANMHNVNAPANAARAPAGPLSEAAKSALREDIALKWQPFKTMGGFGQIFSQFATGAGQLVAAPYSESEAKYRADSQASQATMESARGQQSTADSVKQSEQSAFEQGLGFFGSSCQWMTGFRA